MYIYVMKPEQWNCLHPAMIDFITDLKYLGSYYAYDCIMKINGLLIANDNDQLTQFKQIAKLSIDPLQQFGLSYMDKYGKDNGESIGNTETFYDVPAEDIHGAKTHCNHLCLSFLVMVIKALEGGRQ